MNMKNKSQECGRESETFKVTLTLTDSSKKNSEERRVLFSRKDN
jgi:hypothetical protein